MRCPNPLPPDLELRLAELAHAWAASSERPRVPVAVRRAWAELIDGWIAEPRLPLLIRRAGAGRGQVVRHATGRDLVPADNSPAHWSLALALAGQVPTLEDLHSWFEKDLIPVAMVLKKAERGIARYRCTRLAVSLNGLGWKVAHLEEVGLGRATLADAPIGTLHAHFRRFLDPGNMFLVPLAWAGLAEVSQMVTAIRAADAG